MIVSGYARVRLTFFSFVRPRIIIGVPCAKEARSVHARNYELSPADVSAAAEEVVPLLVVGVCTPKYIRSVFVKSQCIQTTKRTNNTSSCANFINKGRKNGGTYI